MKSAVRIVLESEEMGKIFVFIFAFIFLFTPRLVIAESNFVTDYNVTYNVLENALTHVTFDVTLTNKTSQFYASSYSIQVGFDDIKNVLATDNNGKIVPIISKNNNGNKIEIKFNKNTVGINNRIVLTISFDTQDVAQKSGKNWDINIPGLAKQAEHNSFNVNVIVPKFLKKPSYIKPVVLQADGTSLKFTKEDLGKSGISISYGSGKIYKFDLTYHLGNSNLFPIKTKIALPPSTNYQNIEIISIVPKPLNITKDFDGNWLAEYSLSAYKKIDVKVVGKANILLHPIKQKLSNEEIAEYLKEQLFWQASNSQIKKLALELKTPYEIYKYVVNHLKYDFKRVQSGKPRIGALEALQNPKSAVCLEFTDLFIALARAAGIPAREINGFAYTQNPQEKPLSLVKDVLHAWPEYYDSDIQTWVMVDPTWENATGGVDYFYTLDFDHIAFVIKGVSSTYPIPAGGYKTSNSQTLRDVEIKLSDTFGQPFLLTNKTDEVKMQVSKQSIGKGILFVSIAIGISIITYYAGHLLFFRQKR